MTEFNFSSLTPAYPKEQIEANKRAVNAETDKKEAEDKAKRYKGQRNFWVIFLLIIVVAILGGIFLYMVNQDKLKSNVELTCPNISIPPAPACPSFPSCPACINNCNPTTNFTNVNKYYNST